eukprot:SAG11_NODE_2963_length_2807_cov_4.781019_6_plen_61_part_00
MSAHDPIEILKQQAKQEQGGSAHALSLEFVGRPIAPAVHCSVVLTLAALLQAMWTTSSHS